MWLSNFCHVCGEVTFALQKCNIIVLIKKAYHRHFECKIDDQDNVCSSHKWSNTWVRYPSSGWGRRNICLLTLPIYWKESKHRSSNLFFCIASPVGKVLSNISAIGQVSREDALGHIIETEVKQYRAGSVTGWVTAWTMPSSLTLCGVIDNGS